MKEIAGERALVLAKIEKPQAIARLDEIIAVSDAVMVARGDLGVEMPLERVPGLQKTHHPPARRLGKPVVVATQMLESMISAPVPTRAEVSDVATAVFEGADAVMLSAESASGQYPRRGGGDDEPHRRGGRRRRRSIRASSPPSAARRRRPAPTRSPRRPAMSPRRSSSKVICAWTASGSTGLRIARERPHSSILALTPIVATARRLALAWGVHAVVTEDARDERDMADRACRYAYHRRLRRARRPRHRRRRRAVRHPGADEQPAHHHGRPGRRRALARGRRTASPCARGSRRGRSRGA